MVQYSGASKMPLESDFYLCPIFSHPFIGLFADWQKTETRIKGKKRQNLFFFPSYCMEE